MSLWQTPPPVSAGNSSATPPIPHAPIGTQGDPPPRQQVAAALMMVAVLASWPSDLEPRLQGPNNSRVKIAPLTLATGQQPPNVGPITPVELRLIVNAWPTDYPPILRSPINAAVLPAPPVVTYTPPGRFPEAIGRAWQPPDPTPFQRVESVVPTFARVDQPPVAAPLPAQAIAQILASQPPDPLPVQLRRSVVPSFAAVDQPPVRGVSSLLQLLASWAQTWDAQHAAPNAAWNVPVPQSVPPTRFPAHVYAAWQPPDPPPVQRLRSVVPTFATVSQPPRRPPLLVAQRVAIASWPADLEPRLTGPNASRIPFVPLPRPPFSMFWLINLNQEIGPTPQEPSPL